jgi:hypothetical protein
VKGRLDEVRPPEICPPELRLDDDRPAEVRLAEVRPTEARLDEVRPAKVRSFELRPLSLASTSFGSAVGFSLRHLFQASVPCMSNATCSSLAM